MITKDDTIPRILHALQLDVPVYRYHLAEDGTLTLWLYGRSLPLTVATGTGSPANDVGPASPQPAPAKRKPRKETTHD